MVLKAEWQKVCHSKAYSVQYHIYRNMNEESDTGSASIQHGKLSPCIECRGASYEIVTKFFYAKVTNYKV
jgi:hypothetical protein